MIPLLGHIQQPCKEEFSDWPHGLLAIGTFGNKIKQEPDQKANLQENFSSGQDNLHGLTPEEVGKLSKELNLIFHEHVGPTSANLEATNLRFDKFLTLTQARKQKTGIAVHAPMIQKTKTIMISSVAPV